PAYDKKNEIRVRGYDGVDMSFAEIMAEAMKAPFFPIAMRELSAKFDIKELTEMEYCVGEVQVRARFVYHPGICAGYRLFSSAVSVALDAEVRRLLLFHHDPSHDDAMIDAMVHDARWLIRESGKDLEVDAAREGEEILLPADHTNSPK